jgi:hypothetical protein
MPSAIDPLSSSINEEIFMIRSLIVHMTGLYVLIGEDLWMCLEPRAYRFELTDGRLTHGTEHEGKTVDVYWNDGPQRERPSQ